MGSSKSTKPNGQVSQVYASGRRATGLNVINTSNSKESEGGIIGEGKNKCMSMIVELFNIDPIIHKKTQIGEEINILTNTQFYQCATKNGRLGDVPPQYTQKIDENELTRGKVFELQEKPLIAAKIKIYQ